MTLGFMEQWPKSMAMQDNKTYFIQKIGQGLFLNKLLDHETCVYFLKSYFDKFGRSRDSKFHLLPKLHTIRRDESERWKPGMDIHFVINSRTKDRFQFAPVVKCTSVQRIEVKHAFPHRYVFIDDRYISSWKELDALARNDGFESIEDFFKYFNKDFKGRLIHWTNLRY